MQLQDLKSALIGDWQGKMQLFMASPPEPGLISASRLAVTSIAGGSFLQLNYDWSHEGETRTGVLLFGYDEQNAATVAWVDSFHMSSKIMFCTGVTNSGSATLTGSYAAPPGPDWGWRIVIRSGSANELQIVMHNISPEGQEDLAVQSDYTRRSQS
ncbi:MAG: DUF1579 family protein [Chthoniobacterales bacterium]